MRVQDSDDKQGPIVEPDVPITDDDKDFDPILDEEDEGNGDVEEEEEEDEEEDESSYKTYSNNFPLSDPRD